MASRLYVPVFLLFFGFVSCNVFQKDEGDPVFADPDGLVIQDTVFTFSLRHTPIIDEEDPNFDGDWNWEAVSTSVDTYVLFDNRIIRDAITMPWHTQGNKLNVVNPDIKASDGWRLLMRDFGTESRGVLRPYLSIYNKDTGKLLVAVRNSLQQKGSFAQGKLIILTDSGSVLGSFISGQEKFNQYDGWFNFYFDLRGAEVDFSQSSLNILLEAVGVLESRVQF